jgi:AsmA family protein
VIDTKLPVRWWHRRGRLAVVGVLVSLVLLLGLAEWAGWPFLARPLERALSAALHRPVSLAPGLPVGLSEQGGFKVRFLGGVRLATPRLEIGAPAWSASPYMLLAEDVLLTLRYGDLWRAWRGEGLRIEKLHARRLDGELERLADGRASWQFAAAPLPGEPVPAAPPVPQVGELQVNAGTLRLRDAPQALDIEARMTLVDGDAGVPLFTLAAKGKFRQMPVEVDVVSAGVLPWVRDSVTGVSVPLTVTATLGRASLVFGGSTADALGREGFEGAFTLKGPSLAAVGDPLRVTLPTTAPFRVTGRMVKQGTMWKVVVSDATVGSSRLRGAFTYDAGRGTPLLAGRLEGTRLLLVDLGPVVGTTATGTATQTSTGRAKRGPVQGPGKVLPDRPFDLASLRAMDANVLVEIAELDLNTPKLEPLRPLRGHLQLSQGVLTLSQLDARTAQGRLQGGLNLDGRTATALWTANLRWQDVQLERWLRLARKDGAPPYVSGRLGGKATLQGRGRSTADILGSLSGDVRTELREGSVSHLVVEAAGLDLAQGLGVLIKGDDALPVQCALADLAVEGGVFRPRVMVVDTRDSTLWLDGSVSLAAEAMDLRVVVVPKDFSPLTLRTPLRVRGPLSKPDVSIEKGPAGLKLAASLLLALINPLAAVIPLIDPGERSGARDGVDCQGLVQKAAARRPPASAKGSR